MSLRRIVLSGLAAALSLGLGVVGLGAVTAPAQADPSPSAWEQLRQCESSGNYQVVARNGHYGAYQFSQGTWESVGGEGRPDQASEFEQDYRALTLYRMRGWQPWTCARHVGLREDSDARSGVAPTRAEAEHVNGGSEVSTSDPENEPGADPNSIVTEDAPDYPGHSFRYGDCSRDLRTFQLQMNNLGYEFQGTGCYFEKTRTAVLAIQEANGLGDSGTLGPKTWAAAWNGVRPSVG